MTTVIYNSDSHFTCANAPFQEANTMYLIQGDLTVEADNAGELAIAANCILVFDGGSIELITNGLPGKIRLNKTSIEAPHNHIFKNCTLSSGLVSSHIPVAWFGAVGDGVTDDSVAIQQAIDSCHGNTVLMDNLTYLLTHTIKISEQLYGEKNVFCPGSIKINTNITAIRLKNVHESFFFFNNLISSRTGSAIALTGNCYNNNITVNKIKAFTDGFLLAPRRDNDADDIWVGIQYCKFTFSLIDATYCIHFDMVTNTTGRHLWVNENQFMGGRLQGEFGIYVKKPTNYQDTEHVAFDWINGNVFNCIGFEGINYPISIFHCSFCTFRDLRMSNGIIGAESPEITDKTYIEIKGSKYLTFDIKSYLPYEYLKTEQCHHIEFERCITDAGKGDGQDYSRLLVLNEGGSYLTGASYKFVSNAMTSRNDFKRIYFGHNSQDLPNLTIPYHELFQTIDDGETRILSSQCQIVIDNHLEVTLEFSDHLPHIHSEMIIHLFSADNLGKLIFLVTDPEVIDNCWVDYPVKVIGQPDGINYVQRTGCYRICHDRNNKVYVIPISFNDQTIF